MSSRPHAPPLVRLALPLGLALVASVLSGQETPLFDSSVASLTAAVEEFPDNLGLRLRLARALMQPGPENSHPRVVRAHAAQAEAQLEQVLERSPNHQGALQVLTLRRYDQRRYEEVVTLATRLLSDAPSAAEATRSLVKALLRLGRGREAGIALGRWIDQGSLPGFGSVQGLMATVLFDPDAKAGLRATLEAAIAEHGASHLHLHAFYAVLLAESSETQEAWAALRAGERLGSCNLLTGGRDLCVNFLADKSAELDGDAGSTSTLDPAALEAASNQAPTHAGLALRAARRWHRDGHPDRAKPLYERALGINPRAALAHQFYGDLLLDGGDARASVAHFVATMRSLPDFPAAPVRLSLALATLGEGEEMGNALAPHARLWPVDELVREAIAKAKEKGVAGAVLAAFDRAVAADPKNPNLHSHRVVVALAAGVPQAARESALAAERSGLEGSDGHPPRVLFDAFGEPYPAAKR